MKILVADDHPLVRDALARTLAGVEGGAEIAAAADHEGLHSLAARGDFDLAVVDLNMPGMDGLAGLRRLRQQHPTLPLIVVTGQSDPGTARAVLDAGAAGFVPKSEPAELLLRAVQVVHEGGVFVPPHALYALQVEAGRMAVRPAPAELTPRQRDVLLLLLQGEPNKRIAARLGLAEGTVKLHIAAVLRALQARNRTEAVIRARTLDWPAA